MPEHRLLRRRRAERPSGPATGAGAIASFTDLRAGSPVVHEDHGIARFTGFETKTVGGLLQSAGLKLAKFVRYKVGELS